VSIVCLLLLQIKVVPGNLKRGKAAKMAMEGAVKSSPQMSAREKETARQVRDTLMVSAMVGDVKVVLPGADKKHAWSRKTVMNWR
jgi:hypothetical protein